MAVDTKGRDNSQALAFITGSVAIAPVDADNVIAAADLGKPTLTVPIGFEYLGLRKADGGPEETRETGDAIEFLEEGFDITGDGSISVAMDLAQTNPAVLGLVYGEKPDVNGVIKVKEATPNVQVILLLESVYKGNKMKRHIGVARVSEVAVSKQERPGIESYQVTFQWQRNELFDMSYYWVAPLIGATESAPEGP